MVIIVRLNISQDDEALPIAERGHVEGRPILRQ